MPPHDAVRVRPTRAPQVRIGCSGWQYAHWRGDFYPAELPVSRWFAHYARVFDTVEINNSFYHLPPASTFIKWCEQAPPAFLYAVKASRFLTHMKRLIDPDDPLARFLEPAQQLGRRLGPLLYQLPPRFPLDLARLERFLAALHDVPRIVDMPPALRRRLRHVIEFRDPVWYDDRVFDLLQQHDVALCLHDMQGSAIGPMVVGPFVYVRFHGSTKYGGRYADARLDRWADWLAARSRERIDVFAYFNNDIGGHAPRDAIRLRTAIARRTTGYNSSRHDTRPTDARARNRGVQAAVRTDRR